MKKIIKIYMTLMGLMPMICSCVLAGEKMSSVEQIRGKMVPILNAISWIGYAIAFGMFMYIGIKYLLSAANEKATIKEGALNFVLGGILIAGASTVSQIIAVLANGGDIESGGMASGLIEAAKDAAGIKK